jgi:ribosome-associated protein
MREQERVRARPEGGSESYWIVLDYGDVILHIFDEATREFYDIEHLWAKYSAEEAPPPLPEETENAV